MIKKEVNFWWFEGTETKDNLLIVWQYQIA